MRLAAVLLLSIATLACNGAAKDPDLGRWKTRADAVTITRDDWGIPHIVGTTDADAVFGMMYAQAEDDFNRIEMNYLTAMGRRAEADGESALWSDLRMRLFIDHDSIRAKYAASPEWLRALMDAWADGLNYYLYVHPEVKPKVLTRFEPWMALTFSEGSIGGDIEAVSLSGLEAFYGETRKLAAAEPYRLREPSGSNGFAIAPSRSKSGKALLLINPHTSFFFREELHVKSGEGLNAYGAVTWGQFFVYQGFNARAGWMHTSSGADVIDEYAETLVAQDGGRAYLYGTETRPFRTARVTLRVRGADGQLTDRAFTTYHSHHGPVIREEDGKWITVRLMNDPVKALTQSYLRTKASDHKSFSETMRLHTNSSNNTIFADASGNIAYFHANHVARRDPAFDWSKPVDGSNPATEWKGIHTLEESPDLLNPPTGWIQNTNNWPYSAAGRYSPVPSKFARYFDESGENARGVHAMEVLSRETAFTLESLISAAYDPHLTAFDELIPALVADHAALPARDPRKAALAEPVAHLRDWDRRSGVNSSETSLAVFWGETLWQRLRSDPEGEGLSLDARMRSPEAREHRLAALDSAVAWLTRDWTEWQVQWGQINRFQRLTGDIEQPFNDNAMSTPVGFTSSRWGSLAAFGARPYPGTKRFYGTSGNSFVAVVEFGDSVRAMAVTAGGLNSDPKNKHFNDQAERYAKGALRPVYFYENQLEAHTERRYKPGVAKP